MNSTPFDNKFGINIPFKEHNYIVIYIEYKDLYEIFKFLNISITLEKKSYYLLDIGINNNNNNKNHIVSYVKFSSLKTKMNNTILHSILKSNFKNRNIINLKLVDNKLIFDSDIYISSTYKSLILNCLLKQIYNITYNDILIKILLE
jgi:hypothetical protein